MTASSSELDLLARTVRGLVTVPYPQGQQEIAYGVLNGVRLTGFSQQTLWELALLASSLRIDRPDYIRGVDFNVMNKKVASEIIGIFGERIGQQTKAHDLAKLKERMETWFASVTITRRYLVPCAILTSEGRSFAIGPIRFFHISDLAPEDYDLPRGAGQDDPRLEPVTRIMRDQAAEWLCDVTVEGCEKNRSEEIADLAVDVAIGGLQLVIHPDHGRHMARITARTLPPYRGSFAVTEYGLETGVKNLQPGRALSPGEFEQSITSASVEIAAMGRLVGTYLSGQRKLPRLEHAWCDAVYWFHESLSEPLDTVAIAKLETAIENLFSAGNPRESKNRILSALEGMFGIEGADRINPSSSVRYKDFVTHVVTARSRVLHGTWSTLTADDLNVNTGSVEDIAREFLINYPMLLRRYSNEAGSQRSDDARVFLDWIASNRNPMAPDPRGRRTATLPRPSAISNLAPHLSSFRRHCPFLSFSDAVGRTPAGLRRWVRQRNTAFTA